VPAVIVSPYVAPGSIVRPPPGPDGAERRFDHASIPATLQALFDLGPPLTPRVAAAPDLLCALNLPEPTNNGPPRLTPEPAEPHPSELREYRLKPRNRHQRNLRHPLLQIPAAAASAAGWIRGTSGNALRGRRGRQG
jgi:hypothetical protein